MENVIAAGYPYEVAGLAYYLFFLWMSRGSNRARCSPRSRVAMIVAAIALVACVPLGYARTTGGVAVMIALALVAAVSTVADIRTPRG